MIPILFESSATTFTTQGIGALTEAISCLVTEERNGIYELEMTYPISGHLYNELENGRIVFTTHEYGKPADAFRIYSITKPLNGIVNIKAEHISYQLDNIPVSPFGSTSAEDCMSKLPLNMEEENPFTFETDIDKNYRWQSHYPMSARGVFAGWQGSIIDAYGGEMQWDLWNVKLCASRGTNRGFTIRYGINLIDIKQEENIADVITSIYPYYYSPAINDGDENVLVTLPEKIIDTTHAAEYPFRRTAVYDFTYRFNQTPTVEQLRAVAEQYISYEYVGTPVVSINVKFSQLSKAKEYELLENMETVHLCDTVNIYFEKLKINTTAKVTRIIWDSLRDQYESVTVGDVRSNLSRILKMNKENNENNTRAVYTTVKQSIDYSTNVLTGSLGGHMYVKTNSDGEPEEVFFMDTDNINTARKVLRVNKDGWGFSKTGINGPYLLAAVLSDDDEYGGHLVADLITAGTLNASRLVITGLGGAYVGSEGGDTVEDAFSNANAATETAQATADAANAGVNDLSETIADNKEDTDNAISEVLDDVAVLRARVVNNENAVEGSAAELARVEAVLNALKESSDTVFKQFWVDDTGVHIAFTSISSGSSGEIFMDGANIIFKIDGEEKAFINAEGFNFYMGILTKALQIGDADDVGGSWTWTKSDNGHFRLVHRTS